ncbi:MAG: AAA-like domain-containing protein [Cyanobacteria bacterium P01_A01_bin.116]
MPIEFPCGVLALDSPLYIQRPLIELRLCQNLEIPGSLTRIKGPRRMGKSSLLVRGLAHAHTLNYQTALIDFQSAEKAVYSDITRFLRWLCTAIARQVNLPPRLGDYWNDDIGAKLSATIYFEDYLLSSLDAPLVLALNEVNRVFEHPEIARDFLPLLRVWYEQARHGSACQISNLAEAAFEKLRMVVVHSTEVYVPLDIHQSPFNVGLPIHLAPFDRAESQQLAERYGVVFESEQAYQSLVALVGGHPYFLSVAFYHLAQAQLSLSQLLAEAPTLSGIYRHHLQTCWEIVQDRPVLLEALQRMVDSTEAIALDDKTALQLSSLGLVVLEGNQCRLACQLYRRFFSSHGLPKQVTTRQIVSNAKPQSARAQPPNFQRLQDENEQLKALASLDGLTQIFNRRVFDEHIERAWITATRQQSVLSLIMLDIDFFKRYNDTYGHQAGDFCLKQVAEVLKARVRTASDTVARYGGEEFAVILPETDVKAAAHIARQICEGIRALNIAHKSSQLRAKIITPSVGVASVVPKADQGVADLVAAADAALYVSKQQGRDRLTVSHALVTPLNARHPVPATQSLLPTD